MKAKEDSKYRFLLFCGILAPFVLGITIIVVGQLTPDYNQITDTVSQMGVPSRPYAWLLHSGYYAYAILMTMAAYGLGRTLSAVPGAHRLATLLGIHALGTILLAVFPDSNDSTFKHLLHDVMAVTSYLPLMIGLFVSRTLARQEITLKVAGVLGLFIIIINLPMPVINMINPLSSVGGLLQRILSGFSYLWLALTFLLLYRKRLAIERRSDTAEIRYPVVKAAHALPGWS